MAAPDDQLPKPGSSPPVTSSPTPDSIVPTNAQTAPSTLGARSAFTQEQWQQRIAPNNTPQADPATNTPLSINDDPAFMRIREEANARDQKRFTAGMRGGWSSERIEAELKGTRQRVTDSALQSFVASYPTKALAYAQTDRSAADAVTRYVKDNSTLVKTPGYGDLVEFAKAYTKAQQAESERKSEAFHKRLADEARAEQERRDRLWGRASSSSPKQAVTPPSPIEKAAAPENKSPLPPPGKTQRSPQFIGNVNVGAQKSKFNEFNARAIAFQQGLKAQPAQVPVPTHPKPKANKALTAAGIGVMGATGVGKILIDAGRKGLESAYVSPSSNPDTSKLEYLKKGWEDWREILRRHAGLSEVRTLERFKLWLQENPGAQGPNGALTDKDWRYHDDYQDFLRLDEENKRKAQAKTQDQPRKKPAQHSNEEYYSRPHYSLSDDVEDEESPSETQTDQAVEDQPIPSRPRTPSPQPQSNNQSQQAPPAPSVPRGRAKAPTPGPGGLGKTSGGLRGVAKVARFGALLWPWGYISIGIIIIFAVIFKPDVPDIEEHQGNISIATSNTQVKNPETLNALGASTGPTERKAVLAAIDDIRNFLENGLSKLTEIAQTHKDSLVTYTITATYNGPAREIEVIYPIPEDAMFINASGVYKEEKGKDETTGIEKTTKITWLFSENDGTTPSLAPSTTTSPTTQGISYTKYTQSPYFLPAPQSGSDISYSATTIDALNRLGNAITQNQTYLRSKYPAEYVDPFLSVIWVGAIEGIGDNPYFWNCKDDRSITINMGCSGGYYSGGWQVGYGIQVSQVSGHLAADFDSIYGAGSSGNATKVKEVGQAVISGSGGKISNPSTFPSETISSIVGKANSGNQAAQQAIAILLMDQKLGATTMALEIAGDIRAQNNWAQTMRGWGSYYTNNMQSFSNRAKALADRYSGVDGGGSNNSGSTFGTKSFTVTVLPLKPNIVLNSGEAIMNVDEVAGSSSTTTTDSGLTSGDMGDGRHVPPSTNSCGKYSLASNPEGKNYGDPTCNYEKNKLFDMLKRLDPANANLWFNKVIPCESAYDPNTFYRSGAQGDTPDPYGAWGLFQMGRGVNGPFTDLTKGSTNNPALPEDRGDVNWEMQVSNAVNFNRKYLSSKGRPMGDYWACAR